MATQAPPGQTEQPFTAPTKVCPHCGAMAQTTAKKCPNCGKSYKKRTLLKIFVGLCVLGVYKTANPGESIRSVPGKVANSVTAAPSKPRSKSLKSSKAGPARGGGEEAGGEAAGGEAAGGEAAAGALPEGAELAAVAL